jgi:hypothetical protein
MNQSDEQEPTNGQFAEDKSSMVYLEAREANLDGGLTIMAREWKTNEPKEPLNMINARTFAERVEEVLTIEAFRAWLESKDGDDIVGVACEASACPIHEFLEPRLCKQVKAQGVRLEIHDTEVVLRATQRRTEVAYLPEWANRCVGGMDAKFGSYPSVTAKGALAILAEVEKELVDTSEEEGG